MQKVIEYLADYIQNAENIGEGLCKIDVAYFYIWM